MEQTLCTSYGCYGISMLLSSAKKADNHMMFRYFDSIIPLDLRWLDLKYKQTAFEMSHLGI
jgi:hypothetical protein